MLSGENNLSRSARRVQQALDRLGVELEVRELQSIHSHEWSQMVARYRRWSNDLFDSLDGTK